MNIKIIIALLAAILSNTAVGTNVSVKNEIKPEIMDRKQQLLGQEEKSGEIQEASQDSDVSGNLKYGIIIEKYITAIKNGWTTDDYQENGMCTLVADNISLSDVGYYIMDLDFDGISELYLGKTNGDSLLYEIYTLKDGEPFSLFNCQERDRYYYCIDGVIENESSGGADYTRYMYYELKNMQLKEKASLLYDGSKAIGPWFYNEKEPWDSDENPISEEYAQMVLKFHTHMILPFTPLSQYEGIGNESPIDPLLISDDVLSDDVDGEIAVA